jgi:capsular exopolysaccharide synthesis family protein
LRRFKENNKVIALTEEANSSVSVLANLKNQIAQAEANLADVSARSAELRRKIGMSPQEALAASSLSQSAGVQTALADYQKIDSQLALERTRFRDTTPAIADLEDKRAALRAILKERVRDVIASQSQVPAKNLQVGTTQQKLIEDAVQTEVQRLGLASQVAVLSNVKSTFEQRADTLPRLEQNQRELERKLNAAQSTYEVLLKKLQEAQVAENQNIGNARILETAVVPSQPINSRTQQSALIGGILGLLLGSAAALILEARDTSIKTISEARELFGYTLLGTIPFVGKKVMLLSRDSDNPVPELPVRDTPRSPVSEAYRMLQANLKFLSSDQPLKVIVVTSSIPKEGKSTISANLAAAIAQLGRKVLLVDADMRHPLQHHIWELTNAVGLSDVLVAQAEFKTAVKEVMPNLHVLSSGVMPPNPVALLDSKRMASLVEGFAASYDFVIFDTPPLVGVADTPILGKMASGILLVVRPGVVTVASGGAAQELLKQSGQKVLGMVMNGVVLENEPDSYFHYLKSYSVEDSPASRAKAISQAQQGTKHT